MRVIRDSYNPNRVVGDDSILIHVEGDDPTPLKWREVKILIDEDNLSFVESNLRKFGVVYLREEGQRVETYRLVE